MSALYNSNNVAYGSKPVTISGVTYVGENIQANYPTTRIDRKDEVGAPNGFVLVQGQPTGSMTLQLPTDSSAIPGNGAVCTITLNGTASEKWVVESVGVPYEQAGYRKLNIGIVKDLF